MYFLSTVKGCLLLFTVGFILHIFYLYLKLRQQVKLLSQQLQVQQHLMNQVFASIHNNPLQLLAFLIRELQLRDIHKLELIEYLNHLYRDIQSGIQTLKKGS